MKVSHGPFRDALPMTLRPMCAHRLLHAGLRRLAGAALLGLAGCASNAPPTPSAPPPVLATPAPAAPAPVAAAQAPGPALLEFQSRQRQWAEAAGRRGLWAEALTAWDVLIALNPGDSDLPKRRSQAQQMATQAAQDKLLAARSAAQRNDPELATRLYLDVLALAPQRTEAADALRQIERERVRRQHLGQLSRNVLTRRGGMGDALQASGGSAVASVSMTTSPLPSSERNELEHASLLATQGEIDSAIQVIRPLAQARTPDPAAKQLLADLYFRQAEALVGSDRAGAIAVLERCLKVDPGHAKAAARLKELRAAAAVEGTKAIPRKPTPANSR